MKASWDKIKQMIDDGGYVHRKGFMLSEVKPLFIIGQAQAEMQELVETPDDASELADLFGVLIHYAIKMGWSMEYLEKLLLAKLDERFSLVPGYVKPRSGVYVASKTKHAMMWRALRNTGVPIISSWIDEAEPGQTECMIGLWKRISNEVKQSLALIMYVDRDDVLKGALIETGMAIGHGIPVCVVLGEGVEMDRKTFHPIGSWRQHPLVSVVAGVREAVEWYYEIEKQASKK